MDFTFIHAADLHLDSPLRGLERYEGAPVDEIRGATRRALENLVALAIERKVDFVLIAGDLYDGDWKDHNTGLFFVSQMVRLREADIPVVAIRGNHDAANVMTRKLQLPSNVELLSHLQAETAKSKKIESLGVAVHGRSFAQAAVMENLVEGYPQKKSGMFNIGILHTSLSGAKGHAPYAPCTVDDLLGVGYDYWALGHVHARRTFCEDPPILFSGNLQGRHIRETGAKGCLVVQVDNRGKVDIEFQPLDVFRWASCEVDVSGLDRSEEILERIASELKSLLSQGEGRGLAVRVLLTGSSPTHGRLMSDSQDWLNQVRSIALDVGEGNLWIEKVVLQTTAPFPEKSELSLQGPMGALLDYLDELRTDDQMLLELGTSLEPLRRKLPAEIKEGEDPLTFENTQQLRQVLVEIEPLLVERLLGGEQG